MLNSAKLGNTFFSTYVQQVTFEKRKLMFYGTPSHIFFTIQKCEYQKRCLFRADVLKSRIVVAFPRYFLQNGWSRDYGYARPEACL